MADRETTYAPGSVTTTVAGPPGGLAGGGGEGMFGDAVRALIALKTQQAQDEFFYAQRARQRADAEATRAYTYKMDRPLQLGGARRQPQISAPAPSANMGAWRSGPAPGEETAIERQAREARAFADIAQSETMTRPQPMKLNPGGAGYTGAFYTPDTQNFTGAQRKAYLPGQSQEVGYGRAAEPAGGQQGGETDFERFARESDARRRINQRGYGA